MLKAFEPRESVRRPSDVYMKCLEPYAFESQEHLIVLCLNTMNEVVHTECITKGIANRTAVHPREVFHSAILHMATSIIIAHNHPSGAVKPSISDKKMTESLIKAGEILGIPIRDHIIFSYKGFFSFALNNLLARNKESDFKEEMKRMENDSAQDSPMKDLMNSISEQRSKLQGIVAALDKEIEAIGKIQGTDEGQNHENK
ncbi:MAG: hypothetical protein K6G51_03680 [Sphaerochaetaceae bacterium]|nr:hypothetical protein [Sphaerochaetaceae bacterium]